MRPEGGGGGGGGSLFVSDSRASVRVCVFRLSVTVAVYLISAGWVCSAVKLLSHRPTLQRACVCVCVCKPDASLRVSEADRIPQNTSAPYMELLVPTQRNYKLNTHVYQAIYLFIRPVTIYPCCMHDHVVTLYSIKIWIDSWHMVSYTESGWTLKLLGKIIMIQNNGNQTKSENDIIVKVSVTGWHEKWDWVLIWGSFSLHRALRYSRKGSWSWKSRSLVIGSVRFSMLSRFIIVKPCLGDASLKDTEDTYTSVWLIKV